MTVKSAGAWSGLIVCKDDTGALSTPSVGPVGALYVDGAVNAASVTVTGSNPYKWAVTLPALTAGQRVSMYITATIDSVATASVVAEESADTSLPSETYAIVSNATYGNSALNTDIDAILADTGTDGVKVASGAITAAVIATDAIGASELAADAVAEIADAVWDELIAGHTVSGSMADELSDVDEDVWAYATRTLTVAAATAASGSTTTITCTRGDTMSQAITGLGDISSRSKLWFTVKLDDEDTDAEALIQIEETDGLKYLNGAAAGTAANGDITVDDEDAGDITIVLKAAETDDLRQCTARYDVQMLTSTGTVTTLTSGIFDVVLDQTRAVA